LCSGRLLLGPGDCWGLGRELGTVVVHPHFDRRAQIAGRHPQGWAEVRTGADALPTGGGIGPSPNRLRKTRVISCGASSIGARPGIEFALQRDVGAPHSMPAPAASGGSDRWALHPLEKRRLVHGARGLYAQIECPCFPYSLGRVEVWRDGGRPYVSVAAPFVWRCLTGSTWLRFHTPLIEPDVQIYHRLSGKQPDQIDQSAQMGDRSQ
jgi:hypothetical protein